MDTFYGTGRIPGAAKAWPVELDIDWAKKEIEVRLQQPTEATKSWPGLLVQAFGADEAAFRTKGIPPLGTHWWHIVRYTKANLWVMVLGLPDIEGVWPTCSFGLKSMEV
ncbi:MAG: hypothetical protein A2Y91_03745 [Chloroflexi bacterium RBG_13_54_8]|nr:MAG: hypothetical protein A2Y91_03745 [Chloroflexi bacterium RBG_13_54_8]